MSDVAVKINSIVKLFPGVKALNDVSFEVKKGDVHCIVGENGAGKSTLMKIISGVQLPDSGHIEVFGEKVLLTTPQKAKEKGIGIVYQELSNFTHLDVASNIYVNNIPKKGGIIDYKTLYGNARETLDHFSLTHIDEKAIMSDISLGAQQMVEIATILTKDAKIVILDEPTSALTEVEAEELFSLIAELKKKDVTIIYISHKLDEILMLADGITVLKDGTYVDTLENTEDLTKEILVEKMVGREVEYRYNVGSTEIGDILLELENFESGTMVKDVSLTLRAGEILGIAGLEGAGRTELLQALFGFRPQTGGKAKIQNKEVVIKNPIDAQKNKLAYITKERKHQGLFQALNVNENIVAANTSAFTKSGIIQYKKIDEHSKEYVEKMHIKTSSLETRVESLSGGNQQKVLLSMWLTTNPNIILIDEPTRGVDVGAKAEIHKILRSIVAEGKGVIIVSSEVTELIASCDRCLVMFEGGIVGNLSNEECTEERLIKLASGIV